MKRLKWWLAGAFLILALGLGYVYSVYHGYIMINGLSASRFPIKGVDVSHYQGEIDWNILSREHIQFAYIKATEGSSHIDSRFAENWEKVQQTDLRAGAYHFFSFDSEGRTQALNFIETVKPIPGMLPPVVDVEFYGNKKDNPPDPEQVQEQLQVFLDATEAAYGLKPVIYSTQEAWELYIKDRFASYPLWIRDVIKTPALGKEYPWTFWQYTNRGRLKGYSGEEEYIDINVFGGDEKEWEELIP